MRLWSYELIQQKEFSRANGPKLFGGTMRKTTCIFVSKKREHQN